MSESLLPRIGAMLILIATTCQGQLLPMTRLSWIFPPGAAPGATTEVRIAGSDLDDVTELRFTQPGIKSKRTGTNLFEVTVAKEVLPATYDVRAVGRYGISNPRLFMVEDYLQVSEEGAHQTMETAARIDSNTVVNARANPNAIDYYRFGATNGQRLIIRCTADQIDSRLQPSLILSDSNGNELERNRHGGMLDFLAPSEADYILAVFDNTYRGGDEYFYRLCASTRPQLDYVLPGSGQAGATGSYVLYGRNLPQGTNAPDVNLEGKPLEQLTVEIKLPPLPTTTGSLMHKPASAVMDGFEYRLRGPAGFSNPLLISYATAPVTAEQTLNDRAELAQQLTLPCEVTGQFYPAGDQDWFSFEAKKGDVYWVEIFSHRLDQPTQPFLLLQRVTKNDKGQEQVSDLKELYDNDANFGGLEFNTTSRDPAWRFEVSESGQYRLVVRDLFNRGRNRPDHIYRLSLRHERPDFRLVAVAKAPPEKDKRQALQWTAFARRGETIPVQVMAFRRDGFSGRIELTVEDLPPGLRSGGGEIKAGANTTELLLTADDNAPMWAGDLKIVGRAVVQGSNVLRVARGGVVTWTVPDANTEPVEARLASSLALGLSGDEQAPLTITLATNSPLETSVAGKVAIPLRIARRGEFREKLKLKATGPAGFEKSREIEVEAKDNQVSYELNLSELKVEPGSYTLHFQTQTKGKYRNNYEAALASEEAVKDAEKKFKDVAQQAKSAEESKMKAAQAAAEATQKIREAEAALTRVKEEVSAAEKRLAESKTKAAEAAQAQEIAQAAANQAAAAVKEAETKKVAASDRAKELKDKSRSRDATVNVYSEPVKLKVTAAPINLVDVPTIVQVAAGESSNVEFKVERLYGYNEEVDLSVQVPEAVKGVKAEKATLRKDASTAKLKLDVAPDAAGGDHKVVLQADLKLNGQNIKVQHPVTLKILPAAKKADPAVSSQAKAP